jgi:hypothetical protein
MSYTDEPKIQLAEALAIIKEAVDENGLEPPVEPEVLNRDQITTMVAVFQPRALTGSFFASERHIENLKAALGHPERPHYLDPLTVWWVGDRYYVIDGHHRRLAYQRANVSTAIPVRLFRGSMAQAMAYSAAANSRDKLPMTKQDKLNRAWLLTVVGGVSKREVENTCGVSRGSVTEMRRTLADLRKMGTPQDEVVEFSWREARDHANGIERPMVFPEDALRARAERMRGQLYKAIGKQAYVDPDAFALALKLGDDRLPMRLMESLQWAEDFEDLVRARADEFDPAKKLAEEWDADADY